MIIRVHRTQVLDASGSEALRETAEALHRRGIRVVVQGLSDVQLRVAVATGAIRPAQHAAELPDAIDLMCEKLGEPGHASVTGGNVPLFSYGSFTQPGVHQRVYGRRLIGRLDSLPGYRLRLIEVPDDQTGTLGLTRQPAAVAATADDLVAGMLYTVDEAELAAVDAVNARLFTREWVTLASGESAWVFVARVPGT